MGHVGIRGGFAAIAIALILVSGTAPIHAQQAALSVDPRLAAKGEWDAGTTYARDDIVTARGSSWISLRNNNLNKVPGQTQPSTATSWRLFARGFNPLGAWSNVTQYQPDDLVTRSGQTYRAKLTNTNRPPTNTTFWEVFAARGAAGPNTGIADGTTSAPSISFAGDSNTGIYSPGAGKIALVEDGTLFMHNIGSNNTALGSSALESNIGSGNTGIGRGALASNTSGSSNTAIGNLALVSVTTGGNNTAVGNQALGGTTTAGFNTAMGAQALGFDTTGSTNSAFGYNGLGANTTGNSNSAFGFGALAANTTATGNSAFGTNALASNTTGASNTALGNGALTVHTTGNGNTAVGTIALENSTTAVANTAVGEGALSALTSGGSNVGIGFLAGAGATNPANSIFIANSGDSADVDTIKIGTQGTQTTAFMAGIAGVTVANSAAVLIDTTTGQLGTVASSRRYKEDIAPMVDVSAMLERLRPVTFRYKAEHDDGRHELQYGLIAEEVAEVLPYLTVFNKEGKPETVKYHLLPSFLLAGWQTQQNTIVAQAAKIEVLSAEARRQKEANAALEARLARLEAALPPARAASLHQR